MIARYIPRFLALSFLLASFCGACRAQAFSVVTQSSRVNAAYRFTFRLNYDRAGDLQQVNGPVWQWSFYLETGTPAPTDVVSPAGWAFLYKPSTGECVWYTQGPNGWASGDFGAFAMAPGASLSGFALTTPVPPGNSLARVYDTAKNTDCATATIPVVPLGDINSDYVFSVADVVLSLRFAAGLTSATPDAAFRADVIPDGRLSLHDALVLIRYLAVP